MRVRRPSTSPVSLAVSKKSKSWSNSVLTSNWPTERGGMLSTSLPSRVIKISPSTWYQQEVERRQCQLTRTARTPNSVCVNVSEWSIGQVWITSVIKSASSLWEQKETKSVNGVAFSFATSSRTRCGWGPTRASPRVSCVLTL